MLVDPRKLFVSIFLYIFREKKTKIKFEPSAMFPTNESLIRELNPREKRRYLTYNLLPVDAVDSSCFTKDLPTKTLYRYGCNLTDMNLEIEDNGTDEKRNPIFHLQGFHSFFAH